MADSSPEPESSARVWLRAALAGLAIGSVALAGGSLVILASDGLLLASAGLVCTVLVALLVGMWVGAPGASAAELPLRERWMAAGLATALAGAFATFWALYEGLEGSPIGRILGLVILVAAPLYAVGMLLPTLLASAERRELREEEGAGGWGALGEVVLGVLGGMTVGVLLSGIILIPWLSPGALLLGLSVLLLVPVAIPEPEDEDDAEELLHESHTAYGTVRVTEMTYPGERQPERRLYLGDEQESGELIRSGAPTLAYVAAAEAWLASGTPGASSYLFLGGGGYTLPRRVAERDSRARITVVELNAEVTRLAYRYFGVRREHAITTVHGDARAFLERGAGEFDRLYLDVYAGEESLPPALVTVEAFQATRRRLRPGGIAGINLIGVAEGPEAVRVWAVVRTFAEVFPSVALYTHHGPEYPDRQNFLLVGGLDPAAPLPSRAGLFDRWDREQWTMPDEVPVLRDLN